MEELLEQVGACGRFQFLLFPLSVASVPLSGWSMLFMVFGAIEPDWWCVSRDFVSSNASIGDPTTKTVIEPWVDLNGSSVLQLNSTIGTGQTENSTYKRCDMKLGGGSSCERIVFSSDMSTIVSEFHLVCDMAWVPPLIISLQMAGVLVGASIAGQVADNVGRKKTLIGIISLIATFNLITAFSQSWQMFAVMRTLIGVTIGGNLATIWNYPVEFIGVKWRALTAAVPVWGIGSFSFSLVVWALPNWYHIHIVTAVCTAACLLPWICLPESFRYLFVRGEVTKAERVMRKMARWNGRRAPSLHAIQSLHTDTKNDTKKYHTLHLFSSWEMAKISAVNGLMWFFISLSYYGISFGIKNFSGNFYHNFMLMASVEMPPCLLVYHLGRWFGRRFTMTGSLGLSALSVLVVVPVTLLLPEEDAGMITTGLCTVSRMALNVAWNAMTVFVTEIMPTVVRNTGMGFCNTTARFGGILAPYILISGKPYVFFVIVGIAMTLASILPLFLRETNNQPLEDELPGASPKKTSGQNEFKETELEVLA